MPLEMITRSPDLRLIYDDRAKEEKDKFSFIKDARTEAKAEGKLIGRIQRLQQLLGTEQPNETSLSAMDSSQLKKLAEELQLRFEKLT